MARFPFQADPILTALVVSYRNPQASYIADDFLPRTPVGGERFGWQRMPLGQSITVPETRVGRTGRPNVVEFEGTRETSETVDYGLDTPIPQTDVDEATALRTRGLSTYDPEQVATLTLADLMLVDREVRVAKIGQDPTNYAGSAVLPPASMFDDYADSDPIKTIQGAISAYRFFEYNTMTMGFRVFTQLRSHPKIVNAVKGNVTGSGIVSQEELRQLFGMDKVLVGKSFVNTARPGQPVQLTRVWGNNLALTYVNKAANVQDPSTFGMTAQFGTRIAGSIPDPNIGIRGGMKIRVGEQVRELVTAPDAGYLIQNCVAPGA
ncbi:capsid protein [Lichenibacterium ramalinae]|uniref:Capsid protein n=1 Tax=Lichenibacterium ramalinae TaxID=2316527 RepID=A0A4Q2R7T3_9HYPH|nr:capsid protein [Lichenibacterium ramalinae]RYB02031.1 capsid protein [Lichenibacterium ramalinae]